MSGEILIQRKWTRQPAEERERQDKRLYTSICSIPTSTPALLIVLRMNKLTMMLRPQNKYEEAAAVQQQALKLSKEVLRRSIPIQFWFTLPAAA